MKKRRSYFTAKELSEQHRQWKASGNHHGQIPAPPHRDEDDHLRIAAPGLKDERELNFR